ncbi:MAG: hypothetical protein IJX00_02080 [Clostridia bacterium]|nr:hypothetical protein [Clostridia bacterium]
MSYWKPKQMISMRVDSEKYAQVRDILDKKNQKMGFVGARTYTFADIVDKAMTDYIRANA